MRRPCALTTSICLFSRSPRCASITTVRLWQRVDQVGVVAVALHRADDAVELPRRRRRCRVEEVPGDVDLEPGVGVLVDHVLVAGEVHHAVVVLEDGLRRSANQCDFGFGHGAQTSTIRPRRPARAALPTMRKSLPKHAKRAQPSNPQVCCPMATAIGCRPQARGARRSRETRGSVGPFGHSDQLQTPKHAERGAAERPAGVWAPLGFAQWARAARAPLDNNSVWAPLGFAQWARAARAR